MMLPSDVFHGFQAFGNRFFKPKSPIGADLIMFGEFGFVNHLFNHSKSLKINSAVPVAAAFFNIVVWRIRIKCLVALRP